MKSKRKRLQDFYSYELPGDLTAMKGGSMSLPLDQNQQVTSSSDFIGIDEIDTNFIGVIDDIVG